MGFISPNFTQIPNDFFESYLPILDKAELKILLVIMRGTFGYHRDETTISIRDMARQTGLSVSSIMPAAQKLEELGLIERVTDGSKSTHWRTLVDETVSKNGTRRKQTVPIIDTPVYQPSVQSVPTIGTQLGLNKEINKLKETVNKEENIINTQTTNPATTASLYSDAMISANQSSAQRLLLNVAQIAALPMTETARIETVYQMVKNYGEEKTRDALIASREKWCNTRGKTGKYYSPLNLGWVDWALGLCAGLQAQDAPAVTYAKVGSYDL